jgi:hypothetical protein
MVNRTYEDVVDTDTGVEQDIFYVAPFEVPPNPPDAHQAIITSVNGVTLNNEKQSTKIEINLVSRNVPTIEMRLDIWIPKGYLPHIGDPSFDYKTLPAIYFGKGDPRNNNQQQAFSISISNSDNKGTLQTLVLNKDSVARSAGRDPKELGLKAATPGDFEGYVSNLRAMLEGVECIVLRKERGGDPPYNHQMDVKKVLPANAIDIPKLYKGYQPAWAND